MIRRSKIPYTFLNFKYKVYNTTLSARYFVKEIIGEWHIIGNKGHTNVTWQYQFFPKSVIHGLFILNFFKHVGFLVWNCQCACYRNSTTPIAINGTVL
jgi:ribosome-associated toxin RatA of RatAB toxin-antitoxin module